MITAQTIVGGRYRVIKPLGGGGMKLVYLAEDLRLAARPCALAEMVDGFTNPDMQRQAVAAFQREADMLAKLSNEHIPRIFDRFSEQNHHYLVMEFIDGVTLEQALKDADGRLDENRVIDIALQILDTLEYLHGLSPSVIYRDLKPSNVMLTQDGRAKLIDFGIARHFQPLTNATMIGTQGYAPPEQYRGKVETRSDLYALGATMHHALSGRDPAAEAPFSFPPLRKLCPDANPALATLVDNALAYDVNNRTASATEFKRRLLEIKEPAAAQATAAPRPAAVFAPSSAKPQLKLPLSIGRAAPPVSPYAPTALSQSAQTRCPGCAKPIPADSRFCSYCAADLSHVLGPSHLASDPDAETASLSPSASSQVHRPNTLYRAHLPANRPRGLRRMIIILAAIFVGAFLLTKLISWVAATVASLSSPNPPAVAPPAARVGPPAYPSYPKTPPEPSEPHYESPRLAALRQALNAHGYTSVHFMMEGDTIVLWGTVPTETDRVTVQAMVFRIAGVISLADHITVTGGFGGPG
jgi:serine/threonine protein kinase